MEELTLLFAGGGIVAVTVLLTFRLAHRLEYVKGAEDTLYVLDNAGAIDVDRVEELLNV